MATQTVEVLDERRRALVRAERALLEDLRVALAGFDAAADDLRLLREAGETLDELFLLVVVGEFNSGKSAVINALVGETIAEEGITPTTASVAILRYGETRGERAAGEYLVERIYPAPFLRTISIVDTPGTNAIIRRHEEITARFAPRADLVLFVTSADRPFTESERQFMERLRGWGKEVVIVLNKTDLLTGPEQVEELVRFITDNARALLGFDPQVIPVSARLAFQARQIENAATRDEMLRLSGFAALRRYVFETLDEESRVRYKLLNPLGVAEQVAARYTAAAAERVALLVEDRKTEQSIERQLTVFQQDLERDFRSRLQSIDAIVYQLNERASRFFEETMRLGRLPDLLNSGRIKAAFEREVIADSAAQIDAAVRELVEWVVDAELRLWQDISEYLARRRQAGGEEGMLGSVTASSFSQDRRAVVEHVLQASRGVVERYDRRAEGDELANGMRDAVAQAGLATVGGVGLGALIVTLVGTAAADITGILAGVVIASLGLYILPARRRRVQERFRQQSEELRQRLNSAMTEQFTRQLAAALEGVRAALGPYVRFVRAEHERVTGFAETIAALQERMRALRHDIGESGS
ncbi:MAG TPA: dynamin family protein [Chloroflexota bacterium]|nr:dynamin family protein [Chloroflexota bacterium]